MKCPNCGYDISIHRTKKECEEILDYLYQQSGKKFRSQSHYKHINARMKEGFTIDDLKQVVDVKVDEWKGTDMERYLRPQTLFNSEKFECYLNQVTEHISKKEKSELVLQVL